MDIFTKAKDLADAIANSAELASLKEAEMKITMDTEPREIVEEYPESNGCDTCHALQQEDIQQAVDAQELHADEADDGDHITDDNRFFSIPLGCNPCQ